jgi:hypothetical protein
MTVFTSPSFVIRESTTDNLQTEGCVILKKYWWLGEKKNSFTAPETETQPLERQDWNRLRLKCDGTRAETRFRLSAKRKSPFKSAGASVQSTTDSRGVRISGSNPGYTMFRGSVKSTCYPLHSPVSLSLPLPFVTVCHHISIEPYNTYRPQCTGACTSQSYPKGLSVPCTRLQSSNVYSNFPFVCLAIRMHLITSIYTNFKRCPYSALQCAFVYFVGHNFWELIFTEMTSRL